MPASWADAFEMLKRYLAELLVNGERRVVFLDELPGDYVTELVANEVSAAALFEP